MPPNMYFVGVTTSQSAIRRIFPAWCDLAGRPGVELIGLDLAVDAAPAAYREAVQRIRDDAHSRGALVTTHKVAIVEHAGHLIDSYDHDSALLGEVNCLVRRNGTLAGGATDLVTAGGALDAIVDCRGRDVLILGAGGAGTALAANLRARGHYGALFATDIDAGRLQRIQQLSGATAVLVSGPEGNDDVLARMQPGVIVANATGLGKDRPGAPLTAAARFPRGAVAWDFNYRGDLKFLDYAKQAGAETADGWDYFIRGWTSVMSRVLDFEITEERMEAFRRVAAAERPPSVAIIRS